MNLPRVIFLLVLALWPVTGLAGSLIAVRTVPVHTVLTEQDVRVGDNVTPGAAIVVHDVVGLETRVPLYAGRPVYPRDLGPPTSVDRNEIVTLRFIQGALVIEAEGRSLGRGSDGELVRVMNLASRITITGRVRGPGLVEVGR